MAMEYLAPQSNLQIKNQILNRINSYWLEGDTNLDPYYQSKNIVRGVLAYGDDFKLGSVFPLIHVVPVGLPQSEKITVNKSAPLRTQHHIFNIRFHVQKGHIYTKDSLSYKDNSLVILLAEMTRDALDDYAISWDSMHNVTIGEIAEPILFQSNWLTFFPVSVQTNRRRNV